MLHSLAGSTIIEIMRKIYLDYAATTPVDPKVLQAMEPFFTQKFANPSSIHSWGQEAIIAVDEARDRLADILEVNSGEIIFTSSASEANNLALRGVLEYLRRKKSKLHLVISDVEHPSLREPAEQLQKMDGVELSRVRVDREGRVDPTELEGLLRPETALVSITMVQSEVGTLQPIQQLAKVVRRFEKKHRTRIYLHSDIVQAFLWYDCRPEKLSLDLATLSSHKIFGPKGSALLYKKDGVPLIPQILGGGQERGRRSGTENVPALVGLAEAAVMASSRRERDHQKVAQLRGDFLKILEKNIPRLKVLVSQQRSAPHILSVSFGRLSGDTVVIALDQAGVAVSSGTACHSRAVEPSRVLSAMGYPKDSARQGVRFSFGRELSKSIVKEASQVVSRVLSRLLGFA